MNKPTPNSPILHHFKGKNTPNTQLTIAIESIDDEKRRALEQLGKTVKVIPQDENTPLINDSEPGKAKHRTRVGFFKKAATTIKKHRESNHHSHH